MANTSISVAKQYRYESNAWAGEEAEDARLSYVGSYKSSADQKTYNNLVVIPIKIPKLSANNKTLQVTLSFLQHNMASLRVTCTLTNKGKGTNADIQGDTIDKNEQDITVNKTTETPATFTLNPGNYEGDLFLWVTSNYWCDITANRSAKLSYDIIYINPTSPNITNTSIKYTLSSSITVKWDGGEGSANVEIKNYTLKIRKNSSGGEVLYTKTGISNSSTEQTINISGFASKLSRGNKLYATIQAIGKIDGYNGNENGKEIGSINNLPTAPTYTYSGTSVDSSNTITFKITSSSTDSDNQGLSFWYKFDNSDNMYQINDKTLIINHNTTGVSSGSNKIVFYAHDGLEYSNASTAYTFNAVTKLEIKNIEAEHTGFTDMLGNTNLSTATKITLNMESGTPRAIKLYVRTGNTSNLNSKTEYEVTSGFSYDSNTKTVNIPDVGSISEEIKPGYYFQFRLIAVDGGIESYFSNWIDTKRRPYAPRLPRYNNYDLGITEGMTVKNGYYKNKITVNYSNEISASGYAKIKLLEIVANHDNASSQSYTCNYTSDQSSVVLNLEQINENTKTSFIFRITDEAGQTVTSQDPLFTLTKSSKLAFIGSVVDVSQKNLKPLSNTADFIIYHSYASASGVDRENIKYEYRIKLGDKEEQITDYDLDTRVSEQIGVIISKEDINDLALSLVPNRNSYFDTTITITAKDGFGDTQSKSVVFKINFTEPPYFLDDNLRFKIRHDYLIDSAEAGPNVGRSINSTDTPRPENRMINSGEGIIFVLPKAADPNDDIKEYQIYLARKDFTGVIENINNMTFNQLLISIPHKVLEEGADYKDGYYYYRYKASNYTKNEQFYFKVRVVDQSSNASKDLICEDYIIGCRTVSPSFSTGEIKVEVNQNRKATLNYNFIITDLGGSATINGWDEQFYNNYPNFDRSFDRYNRKAVLLVEIAPNQDFIENQVSSNKDNPIEFTPSGSNKLYEFTNEAVSIQLNDNIDYTKMFIRFTLTVSYGLKTNSELATKKSSQIYTYFGSVPTVAHRSHKVGINTTDLDADDVFVIEGYQQSKYVKFKGITNGQTYTITFDLSDGSINGAIIDGGSW